MAKVLKITKPDKTVHVAPINNKAFYTAYTKRQKADKRWKIEEIDEKDAKDLPFRDESHVTSAEAVKKLGAAEKELQEKDAKIAELEAMLAEKNKASEDDEEDMAPPPVVRLNAKDTIELIKAATTPDQVNELVKKDEDRVSVVDAGKKKIAELEAK